MSSTTRRSTILIALTLVLVVVALDVGVVHAIPVFNDSVLVNGASFCSTDCEAGGDSLSTASSSVSKASFPWTATASATSDLGFLETSTRATRTEGGFGGVSFARATSTLILEWSASPPVART